MLRTLIAAFALIAPAAAASASTVEDEQLWVNVTTMGSIKDRLIYFVEAQPRVGDGVGRLSQLLLRGGVGWKISDSLSLYGGYLHLIQPVENGPDTNEERPFIQLSWQMGQIAGGALSTRTRLEHRDSSTSREVGWRVRSMIRYAHPLGGAKTPKALVWAEPFIGLNDTDWSARSGFDQLRSFAGLELPLAGKSTLEAGYMNQAINDRGPRNRMNHIASLTLFIRP
jgi:hypothetical protein